MSGFGILGTTKPSVDDIADVLEVGAGTADLERAKFSVSGERSQPGSQIVVSIGNSINAYGFFISSGVTTTMQGFSSVSHQRYLLELLGPAIGYKQIAATANCDILGNYGIPGQLLGDAFSSGLLYTTNFAPWVSALDMAGIVPTWLLDIATVENDIANGRSAAQIIAARTALHTWARQKWPNVKIMCATPRPDNRISINANFAVVAAAVRADVLTRANSWCCVADVSRTNSLGDTWNVDPTRCSDTVTPTFGVHPNAKGARAEAVVVAAAMRTIGKFDVVGGLLSYDGLSSSTALAVGVWAGGTRPLNVQLLNGGTGAENGTLGWDTTPGACSSTALGPGHRVKLTVTASPQQLIWRQGNIVSNISGLTRRFMPTGVLKINSGGANIKSIAVAVFVTYADGFVDWWSSGLNDGGVAPGYTDGETIFITAPPFTPKTATYGGSKTIANITAVSMDVYVNLMPSTTIDMTMQTYGAYQKSQMWDLQ